MNSDSNTEMRVVVADDEPIMQMYLEETVSLLGLDVVGVARDGCELVEKCKAFTPDLIVTDIRMPRMDGYSAVQEICRQCPMPVLFISGFDEAQRLDTAQNYCIPTYLMKPVDEARLQQGIHTVLERFKRYHRLMQDEPDPHKALHQFRRVQQAIIHIHKRESILEDDAFDRLLQLAEEQGLSLVEAADRFLDQGPSAAH